MKNSLRESAERDTLERIHKDLIEFATYLVDFVSSKPYKPRVCERMQHRENHPATESIDYYRVTVTTQFLDQIIMEIDAPISMIKGFSVIPSSFINNNQTNWKEELW